MSTTLHKKSILKKTLEVGSSTFVSRMLGMAREVLIVRYLGAGALSDAFFTAFKLPNSLRKIFAEGALSAAFIPTIVGIVRRGNKEQANRLMALAFLVFEGTVLVICALAIIFARTVIGLIAPGFSEEQIGYAVPYLKILMPFIFFISSSALLAGALQSVNHFFVPAFSPVLLNIVFIGSLILCLTHSLPVEYLCFFILLGGFVQFVLHLVAYLKLGFSWEKPDAMARRQFAGVLSKFFPVLLAMSVMEINLFIDTSFGSYLPKGSVSLIHYASRFMGIPLGVFAVAFSTILLPHFSRVSMYAPRRLSFYLLEATKFIFWVTVPVALFMMFVAEPIFYTIFLSKNFTVAQVNEAQSILQAFLFGLFFFSLNKILLNIYYALHETWVPTFISLTATIANIGMNYVLMNQFGSVGLALATSLSGALQTVLFVFFLYQRFNFTFYLTNWLRFVVCYAAQLIAASGLFYVLYNVAIAGIARLPHNTMLFLTRHLGFWLWIIPLALFVFVLLYLSRKLCGVRVYFLD